MMLVGVPIPKFWDGLLAVPFQSTVWRCTCGVLCKKQNYDHRVYIRWPVQLSANTLVKININKKSERSTTLSKSLNLRKCAYTNEERSIATSRVKHTRHYFIYIKNAGWVLKPSGTI